jgi:NAD-binding of NADP-dependent 3-hydroxyisobutyrate dehydrogenase
MALVQVRTSGREGTQPAMTASAAETSGATPRWQVVAASFAVIIVSWLLSVAISASFEPTALVVPAGIGLFAMLYAVTQGLERLLEPVSAFFFSTKQHAQTRDETLAAAVNVQTAGDHELPTKLSELAKAAKASEVLQVGEPVAQQAAAAGRLRRNLASDGVAAARHHVDGPGAGAATKVVVNSTLGAAIAAFGEALALGEVLGLDRPVLLDTLADTAIGSTVKAKRANVESGEYPPNFKLSLALKDLRLVDELAHRAGQRLAVASASRDWLERAAQAGAGDLDYSAVLATITGDRTPTPA